MDGDARVRIVGGLELVEAVHLRPRFSRHAHPTYALGVVLSGANRFRARGALHVAAAGMLCTVNPDEAHEVEPGDGAGFAYQCLYPSVDVVSRAAAALGRQPRGTFAWPPVVDDPVAARLARAVFAAEPPVLALERDAQLLALLGRILTRHASPRAPAATVAAPPRAVAAARDLLAAHLAENVPLERLAAAAGLEPFALLRAFRRTYGLPPHAWVIQERVRRAQVLLRRGHAPGAVAAEVGFADQSHLNRHFKRHLGVTPGCYRAAFSASRAR